MSGPVPTSSSAVEVQGVNVAEAALALGHSVVRRARLVATLVDDVVGQRRPPGEAIVAWLDGQEADLEELSLRWKLAGLRWPLLIMLVAVFAAGVSAGRRGQR